jgi:hypothetical protein
MGPDLQYTMHGYRPRRRNIGAEQNVREVVSVPSTSEKSGCVYGCGVDSLYQTHEPTAPLRWLSDSLQALVNPFKRARTVEHVMNNRVIIHPLQACTARLDRFYFWLRQAVTEAGRRKMGSRGTVCNDTTLVRVKDTD